METSGLDLWWRLHPLSLGWTLLLSGDSSLDHLISSSWEALQCMRCTVCPTLWLHNVVAAEASNSLVCHSWTFCSTLLTALSCSLASWSRQCFSTSVEINNVVLAHQAISASVLSVAVSVRLFVPETLLSSSGGPW